HDPGTCAAGMCTLAPDKCQKLANDCLAATCNIGVGCMTMPINEGGACDLANICATSAGMNGNCIGTPITANEGASCDDGKWCTVDEICTGGKCTPMPGHSRCPPDEGCGTWSCDESKQMCAVTPKNEGMACSFGSCMTNQTCSMGVCSGTNTAKVYFFDDFSQGNAKGWTMPPPQNRLDMMGMPTLPPCDAGPCVNDWEIAPAHQ